MQSYDYVHVEDLAMAHLTALEYTFAEAREKYLTVVMATVLRCSGFM